MICRFCGKTIDKVFIDLGSTAVANAFLTKDDLSREERIYPLRALVCDNCFLVQVETYQSLDEIFSEDYVYFSSVSTSWLEHCKLYAEQVIGRFNLGLNSLVIEIASNDGYLLQFFKERNIPCLGIEPTRSTADVCKKKGIETLVEFFDEDVAKRLEKDNRKGDLMIGNNVLAHVPNLNGFVRGLKINLKFRGVVTLEFPHLIRVVERNEFDTIYHEHFSYFSFYAVKHLLEFHGFEVFDVEELSTHGGSLRVFLKHRGDKTKPVKNSVRELYEKEMALGINQLKFYEGFQEKANDIKNRFLKYIIDEKMKGKGIVGFGAAAKGNTFLNYCGIKSDIISYVVDDTPTKQRKFLPQSRIPVVPREVLIKDKPDIVVILPWNFRDEIIRKLEFVKEWGGQFVTYIPELRID